MLSRMAVALVFPMFMGAVCVIRSVILFQRGRKHDKEVRSDTLRAAVRCQACPVASRRAAMECLMLAALTVIAACAELQHHDRQKDGRQPCRRPHCLP